MKMMFKEVVNALGFGLALIVGVIIGAVGSGLVGGGSLVCLESI